VFAAPQVVQTEIFTRLPDEFRIRTDGTVDLLMQRLPFPNGLVLSPAQNELYMALTYTLQMARLPAALRRTLFITESDHGAVLTARMEAPGRPMYSDL